MTAADRLVRALVDEYGLAAVEEALDGVRAGGRRRRATVSDVEAARRAALLVEPTELDAARARRMKERR